jgi:hypothetical protein
MREYIARCGGRDTQRRHWFASFGVALLSWLVLGAYGLGELAKSNVTLFTIVLAAIIAIVTASSFASMLGASAQRNIERAEWERMTLLTMIANRIEADAQKDAKITFDPKLQEMQVKLEELERQISRLKS